MKNTDDKIAEILAKYEEPLAGSIWRVQGQPVIYHKVVERIAAKAKISFDPPMIVRAAEDEAVLIVSGRLDSRTEWSVGEAKIGVNYRVSGKQAAYLWSMAEKRGKDRVVLKLIELHGLVYSEEESDDFKDARPSSMPSSEPSETGQQKSQPKAPSMHLDLEGDMIAALESRKTLVAIDKLWNSEQFALDYGNLDEAAQARVTAIYQKRRADLRAAA